MARSFLLDTNVISELARPRPDARVISFLRRVVEPQLSTITLHELIYGAERAPDGAKKAKVLEWVAEIESEFAGRLIPIDDDIAQRSGRLRALADAKGRPSDPLDALIGAAAEANGLTLATRNTKEFASFGIPLFDPWAS